MKKFFYTVHRKLAIWLAVPVFLWALSGLLHPMMANWLRPEIASHFIPPRPITSNEKWQSPATVFSDQPALHQLKLVSLAGHPTYLGVTPDQELHYRDATTGETIPNAVERHTEQLARAYVQDKSSELLEIKRLTEFSETYSPINRLLPAYRVILDREDGLEVVVDPRTGRLATFDTPSKRLFSKLFSWFHTWSFLGKPSSPLRITAVLVVSSLTLAIALSGVVSLFFIKRKKGTQKTRRWHRLTGAISAVFFFLFGLSGVAHVAAKYRYDDSTQWTSAQSIETRTLTLSPDLIAQKNTTPVTGLSLAKVGEKSYYRFRSFKAISYHATTDGTFLPEGEETFARQLACEFSGYSPDVISEVEPITKFRKDYGFIFKRLPVWRVKYQDQPIWQDTVDTEDAHMAMRTTPARLVEALSFIYLHKFHFLDFAGRDARDIASAIAVGLIALTTLMGCLLWWKRKQKRSKA